MPVPANSIRALGAVFITSFGLHASPSMAANFTYTQLSIDPNPNDLQPSLVGLYQDQVIAEGPDGNGNSDVTFVWSKGTYTLLPGIDYVAGISDNGIMVGVPPGETTSFTTYNLTTGILNNVGFAPTGHDNYVLGGINASGTIVASAADYRGKKGLKKPLVQAFEQQSDGSFTWLTDAKIDGVNGLKISDNAKTILLGYPSYVDKPFFTDKQGKIRKYSVAGAQQVQLSFMTGSGVFGGQYENASGQYIGFTSRGGPPATYSCPDAINTYVSGTGPHGETAGFFSDHSGHFHGFIYRNGTYSKIDYPNAADTGIEAISSTGTISGFFRLNKAKDTDYLFVGTCPDKSGCTK